MARYWSPRRYPAILFVRIIEPLSTGEWSRVCRKSLTRDVEWSIWCCAFLESGKRSWRRNAACRPRSLAHRPTQRFRGTLAPKLGQVALPSGNATAILLGTNGVAGVTTYFQAQGSESRSFSHRCRVVDQSAPRAPLPGLHLLRARRGRFRNAVGKSHYRAGDHVRIPRISGLVCQACGRAGPGPD